MVMGLSPITPVWELVEQWLESHSHGFESYNSCLGIGRAMARKPGMVMGLSPITPVWEL